MVTTLAVQTWFDWIGNEVLKPIVPSEDLIAHAPTQWHVSKIQEQLFIFASQCTVELEHDRITLVIVFSLLFIIGIQFYRLGF